MYKNVGLLEGEAQMIADVAAASNSQCLNMLFLSHMQSEILCV